MTSYVVDASVGVKWLLHESDSDRALSLISDKTDRVVPDLFFAEIGNVLWKNIRAGNISAARAQEALRLLAKIHLTVMQVADLMEVALEIAKRFDRSFYDSTYLALALRENVPLITADRRLFNAMQAPISPNR